MEFIKYLVPLVIFVLGFLATPYIELMKAKTKNRKIKESILIEIADEFEQLKRTIKVTDESIKERMYKPKDFVHLSLPSKLNLILLSKYLEEIYSDLHKDQRKAYKKLILMEESIVEKSSLIYETYRTDNWQCRAYEQSMLFSMLSAYYLMNFILESKDNFIFPTQTNEEIVKSAAKSLNIRYPFEHTYKA